MTTTGSDLPRILLVHGSFHGSWCWADVAARLAGAGRRVLAVDVAGQGLRARRPATDRSALSSLQEPEQDGDRLAPLFLGDPTAPRAVRLDVGDPGDHRQALCGALCADVDPDEADAAFPGSPTTVVEPESELESSPVRGRNPARVALRGRGTCRSEEMR